MGWATHVQFLTALELVDMVVAEYNEAVENITNIVHDSSSNRNGTFLQHQK